MRVCGWVKELMQKGASLLCVSREQRLELDVCCDRKSNEQRRDTLSVVSGGVLSSECCGEERSEKRFW